MHLTKVVLILAASVSAVSRSPIGWTSQSRRRNSVVTDINRVMLTGTIQEPRITWLESGKPELRLSLTVEQESPFKLYVQVFCYGKDCERLAETLETGSRVLIDGRLSWRSHVKDGEKASKMVVTCFAVEVLTSPAIGAASQN